MARKSADHLRPVEDGELAPAALPKTLADAVDLDRRSFLVRARLEIAATIDGGVPPHALGRLITDMERIDSEIRKIDAADEQEAQQNADRNQGRRSFNSAAI